MWILSALAFAFFRSSLSILYLVIQWVNHCWDKEKSGFGDLDIIFKVTVELRPVKSYLHPIS